MKKTQISISYDEEKLTALRLYLSEKQLQVEEELTKALEGLYAKAVPHPVQHFLNLRGNTPESAVPKKKRPEQKNTTVEKEMFADGK